MRITEAEKMNWGNHGFWTLGTDKQWNDKELDVAFAVFKRLKDTYGDQFNPGSPRSEQRGNAKSQWSQNFTNCYKNFVSPRNDKIEGELRNVGLTYIK